MTDQIPLLAREEPQPFEVSAIRVTLQDEALVVWFAVDGHSPVSVRWQARDPKVVRDLARQLVTLAEGMRGAESVCLCELFRPSCPVHSALLEKSR